METTARIFQPSRFFCLTYLRNVAMVASSYDMSHMNGTVPDFLMSTVGLPKALVQSRGQRGLRILLS